MSADESLLARVASVPSWVVVPVVLAAILALRFGPESYWGIESATIRWGLVGLLVVYALFGRSAGGSGIETEPGTPATVGEHYRPTTDEHEPGVYRVVGAGEAVALLRVGDRNGRRVHTGRVVHVDQSTLDEGFEAAADPDAGISPLAAARNTLSGLYWSLRSLW